VGIPTSPAFVDVIFKECDMNSDGKISLEEFVSFSRRKDEKLRVLFNKLDISHTGDLNKSDIKAALQTLDMNADDETI
jgi:Ca2+-binding EF-hand superfamily protein